MTLSQASSRAITSEEQAAYLQRAADYIESLGNSWFAFAILLA